MIVTKISLTADQQFESEIEINLFFFGSSTELNQAVLEHADKAIANNWILNKHIYTLVNSNTLDVLNYSENTDNARLFADSLSEWTSLLPSDVVVSVEQYPTSEVPVNAVPILVDDTFYLNDNTLDL